MNFFIKKIIFQQIFNIFQSLDMLKQLCLMIF